MVGKRAVQVVAASVALLGMLVTACSGSNEDAASVGERTTAAAARTGGTATILQPADAPSLDPSMVQNNPSMGSDVLNALYDVLFTIDRDGTVVPRLGESLTTDDGTTWTLTLRPGVTFTDGTPLDAEAVRVNWERAAKQIRSSAYSYMADVTAMTVVDPLTLQITLAEPNFQFHHVVVFNGLVWIASPTAIAAEGDDFGNRPVGAGPFVLESRTPNGETVLARNPDYWAEGLPKLDTLRFRTIADPQQMLDTLTTGGAQAWVATPDQYVAMGEDAGLVGQSWEQVAGVGFLFSTKRAPFDDIRARRAVILAVDRHALNEVSTGGTGIVPDTLFPEGSPFHDDRFTFPEHDPVEAQRLFDELAAEGTPVRFAIAAPPGDQANRAVAMQTALASYDNVDVAVDVLDGSTYAATLFSGNFDMAIWAYAGTDPEPQMAGMRSTHAIPIAAMGNPVIDQAIRDGRAARDLAGRKAAYDTLQQELNDEYRMLWLYANLGWVLHGADVTGLQPYGMGGHLVHDFGYVE